MDPASLIIRTQKKLLGRCSHYPRKVLLIKRGNGEVTKAQSQASEKAHGNQIFLVDKNKTPGRSLDQPGVCADDRTQTTLRASRSGGFPDFSDSIWAVLLQMHVPSQLSLVIAFSSRNVLSAGVLVAVWLPGQPKAVSPPSSAVIIFLKLWTQFIMACGKTFKI